MEQPNHPGAAGSGTQPLGGHGRCLHLEVAGPVGMILQEGQAQAPSSSRHEDPDNLGLVALLCAIGSLVEPSELAIREHPSLHL
jgi:hypothetical protein